MPILIPYIFTTTTYLCHCMNFSFFSPNSGGSLSTLYQCKLSSDQRSLLFDPYESESGSIKSGSEDSKPGIPPVDINKVQFTEIHFIPDEDKKGAGGRNI